MYHILTSASESQYAGFSMHTDTTPPQRNTNTHRTTAIQPMK